MACDLLQIKLEYQNTKFETISNDKNPKLEKMATEVLAGHERSMRKHFPFSTFSQLPFGFVSSFDIRISNLLRC